MILDEEVEVPLGVGKSRQHYKNLGYTFGAKDTTIVAKVEDVPKTSRVKLNVTCDLCGRHYFYSASTYYRAWEANGEMYRCGSCATTIKNKAGAHSVEEIRKAFEDNGLIPLFTTYTENKEKLPYHCPNHPGKLFHKTYANLVGGLRKGIFHGCPKCSQEYNTRKLTTPFARALGYFSNFDVTVLSDESEYENTSTKLRYVCNVHPEYGEQSIRVATAQKAKNICVLCARKAFSGKGHPNYQPNTLVSQHLRGVLEYWKTSTMALFDYTCDITGQRGGKLKVHHLIAHHKLRDHAMFELGIDLNARTRTDLTDDELSAISELFVQKHYERPIGVPLIPEVHDLYHHLYGHKKRNTIENYYEFKRRYQSGEFDDQTEVSTEQ